jgi:Conjugative transposon protein TcpC
MARKRSVVAKALGVENIGARLAARRARRKAAGRRSGPTAPPSPPPVVPSAAPGVWPYPPPAPPHGSYGPPPAGPYSAGPSGIPQPPGRWAGSPPARPSTVAPPSRIPASGPVAPARSPHRSPAQAWDGRDRDRPGTTQGSLGAPASAWDVLSVPRREPVWVRLRRAGVLVVAVVVVAVGVLTITGQVLEWMSPATAPARRAEVSDAEFAAAATPFAVDYLSWAESDPQSRQSALARSAAPDTTVDGWGGTGRQWADSPTAIGVTRVNGGGERAVVTVRVRVTPFTTTDTTSDTPASTPQPSPPTPEPGPSPDSTPAEQEGVPNVASGSVPQGPGWTAGVPRWLTVAVPVAAGRDGRVVVTAVPALVGSPQPSAHVPSPREGAAEEDARFARDTREVITTLMRAYGSGELQYARAEGTSFSGLNNAVELVDVLSWRVHASNATDMSGGAGGGGEDRVRVGGVTVMWSLSGGAGMLRCTYRVELRADDGGRGRWYLASIGASPEAVT